MIRSREAYNVYMREYRRERRKNDSKFRETEREYGRRWRTNNPEKERTRRYRNQFLNLQGKLRQILRRRLWAALEYNQKAGSAVSDLGCSIPEFKLYIENQFDEGMTWDNYGNGESKWNIDHVIPLSSFDLTNRMEFLEACNWLNLQPLWWKDNLIKGASNG